MVISVDRGGTTFFFKMKFEVGNVLVSEGTLVLGNNNNKKTKSTASVNIIIESC